MVKEWMVDEINKFLNVWLSLFLLGLNGIELKPLQESLFALCTLYEDTSGAAAGDKKLTADE